MALLTLLNAQLAFGHVPLLDHTDLALEAHERVGLIGRNGAGKSALLKILAGLQHADDGQLQRQTGLRLAYVAQEPALDPESSVADAVAAGLGEVRALIDRYSAGQGDLDALHAQIDVQDGWTWAQRVDETLHRLALDGAQCVGALSGGLKKRVALAQALVTRPDVLLLDEPTNHLDLDAILWLQALLQDFAGALITVSHDRAFLDAVVTRIVELDRGRLRSYPGQFAAYQAAKDAQLAQEAVVQAKADRLLAQEEVWIRQGVEARRTRAQARIERLDHLRAQRAQRREAVGRVHLDLARGQASGRLVAELSHVSKTFGGALGAASEGDPAGQADAAHCVVRDLSLTVLRGDKLALLGPNGAGKSTLLKLILGALEPDPPPPQAPAPAAGEQPWGTLRRGSGLQVAYFDQMRDALDLEATLEDFISPGSEWIEIGARRQHVKSYLADFLFAPERAHAPVRTLSGGERNRLLLARLFARPANVLVLDEPTNDLDIDTLELLEALLADYSGTVFLVSHDRAFVDAVATCTLASEGDGRWREYEGGIQDWLTQRARAPAPPPPAGADKNTTKRTSDKRELLQNAQQPTGPETAPQAAPSGAAAARRKLSYKDQRELEALPARITALEAEQAQAQADLAQGGLYASDPARAQTLVERSAAIEDELMALLERWTALGG